MHYLFATIATLSAYAHAAPISTGTEAVGPRAITERAASPDTVTPWNIAERGTFLDKDPFAKEPCADAYIMAPYCVHPGEQPSIEQQRENALATPAKEFFVKKDALPDSVTPWNIAERTPDSTQPWDIAERDPDSTQPWKSAVERNPDTVTPWDIVERDPDTVNPWKRNPDTVSPWKRDPDTVNPWKRTPDSTQPWDIATREAEADSTTPWDIAAREPDSITPWDIAERDSDSTQPWDIVEREQSS
jgi:hypothetical protein